MKTNSTDSKRPRFWPTTRGKLLELFIGFFPGWIAVVGISAALLLPIIQSCRSWVRENAGQAPPPNVEQRVEP
jgi:hypothetical protein